MNHYTFISTPTFSLSIETDAGTYQHGYHLGTDERMARSFAAEICLKRRPKIGTRIRTVALIFDGRMVDVFDGGDWQSDLVADDHWEA